MFDVRIAYFVIFITGNESWVYGYDNETKDQLSQWKHLEEIFFRTVKKTKSTPKHD